LTTTETISIKEIKAPIKEELLVFEKKFRESMRSRTPLLDKITHYIVKRKGKQVRPMFLFLCAKMFGEVTEKAYVGASLIELLHTATLVHDDVVDDAYQRRGFFSINALWKNKIAVLVGDFLLSKGLLLSIDNGYFDLLKIISEAVRSMSEGELLQIEKARTFNIEEPIYFEVIRQKTASLFASTCACGTASSSATAEEIERMKQMGEHVGMAFQIKDDLFDYGVDEIGKPRGIDIGEKKVTLPLIYSLNKAEKSEKRKIVNLVKNHGTEPNAVAQVISFVERMGGLEYATVRMEEYTQKAFDILDSFPQSIERDALKHLVSYTINRKK
jgi:octaprenyl-diphosphate synthase